ncbi:MAG: UDP-2,3-diacylglucosamine diphosphatase [Gammaproteobacteria bacterium]|nr:MAG: UDP-2,3-diacylglucosamine diphosphatase [Gammaproteobacteria bacterium]
MATLFISDLHLHPSRPAIIACFLKFLEQQQGRVDALYILGDLFESWIGDDHPEPAYQPVKPALGRCSNAGTPVYLMHGNRDFMLGETFTGETGCILLTDPTRIDLYGTPTLLMHGDSLCTDDSEYQQVRARVRDPAWQQQARTLPVNKRLEIAAQARALSARSKQGKEEYIMDVNQDEVLRVIEEHQVDLLIHGHTHRPGSHAFRNGNREVTRMVLGDWYDTGSVLVADTRGRRLETLVCQ